LPVFRAFDVETDYQSAKVSSENCALMRAYLGLKDVAELVMTRYAKFLTGLIVNQLQTELVKIAFNELFTIVV